MILDILAKQLPFSDRHTYEVIGHVQNYPLPRRLQMFDAPYHVRGGAVMSDYEASPRHGAYRVIRRYLAGRPIAVVLTEVKHVRLPEPHPEHARALAGYHGFAVESAEALAAAMALVGWDTFAPSALQTFPFIHTRTKGVTR
jgi:hypothetical protein